MNFAALSQSAEVASSQTNAKLSDIKYLAIEVLGLAVKKLLSRRSK